MLLQCALYTAQRKSNHKGHAIVVCATHHNHPDPTLSSFDRSLATAMASEIPPRLSTNPTALAWRPAGQRSSSNETHNAIHTVVHHIVYNLIRNVHHNVQRRFCSVKSLRCSAFARMWSIDRYRKDHADGSTYNKQLKSLNAECSM